MNSDLLKSMSNSFNINKLFVQNEFNKWSVLFIGQEKNSLRISQLNIVKTFILTFEITWQWQYVHLHSWKLRVSPSPPPLYKWIQLYLGRLKLKGIHIMWIPYSIIGHVFFNQSNLGLELKYPLVLHFRGMKQSISFCFILFIFIICDPEDSPSVIIHWESFIIVKFPVLALAHKWTKCGEAHGSRFNCYLFTAALSK